MTRDDAAQFAVTLLAPEQNVIDSKKLLPCTIAFGLFSAVLWVSSSYMVIDIDLYHEMALFRQFLQEGEMPLTDDFAYTPTLDRVVHHEWATGAVLYWVTVSSGWGTTGLLALKYLLTFSICLGCYLYARWRGVSLAVFSVLALLPLYQAGWYSFTNVRAQVFTLLFLVILFGFLELDRRGKRWWIWFWLPMFIVWANMHAGVVSGMGILGVYGVSRLIDAIRETRSLGQALLRVKHLLFVGVATALLINVNPYGFGLRAVPDPSDPYGKAVDLGMVDDLDGWLDGNESHLFDHDCGCGLCDHQSRLAEILLKSGLVADRLPRHEAHSPRLLICRHMGLSGATVVGVVQGRGRHS